MIYQLVKIIYFRDFLCEIFAYFHIWRSIRRWTRTKKVQNKKWKKTVQWSHPKMVPGEGVQVFIENLSYLVGFVRYNHTIMNQTTARFPFTFFLHKREHTLRPSVIYERIVTLGAIWAQQHFVVSLVYFLIVIDCEKKWD